MWAMRKRGGASIRWRCPVSLLLYDLSSFCLFFLTCSSFFFLFLTRTWTWTWTWTYWAHWHTDSTGHCFTDALDNWITDARAVGVLTLHRADFQRVLAQRAIPPARPHFGKRLVDYVCVPLFSFRCFALSIRVVLLTYLLFVLLPCSFVHSYSVLRMYYTLTKTHPHPLSPTPLAHAADTLT